MLPSLIGWFIGGPESITEEVDGEPDASECLLLLECLTMIYII